MTWSLGDKDQGSISVGFSESKISRSKLLENKKAGSMCSMSFCPSSAFPMFNFLHFSVCGMAMRQCSRLPVSQILICGQLTVRIVNNLLTCGPPPK